MAHSKSKACGSANSQRHDFYLTYNSQLAVVRNRSKSKAKGKAKASSRGKR